MTQHHQAYRANIAAIVVNEKREFLLTQLIEARPGEWDFAKGWMRVGESELDTLRREIREELWEIVVETIARSNVALIYEWPTELQERKGFRGQARVSYWMKHISGTVSLQENELRSYAWFPESEIWDILLSSGFPKHIVESFKKEWEDLRKRF